MLRTLALAIVAASWVPAALACEDPHNIRGIIYHDVPAGTPASAIVLDVEFDREEGRGPLVARIRRVVQGEYTEQTVRVGVINSSCLYPFIFGREGLIIGELRQDVIAHTYGTGDRQIVLRQGFEGVWFRPNTESVAQRRDRTGVDPLARPRMLMSIEGAQSASGDFDGDGAVDAAAFYEDDDGNLVVAVQQAVIADMLILWEGDISSLPLYELHAAPAGRYETACEHYSADCGGKPREIKLTHAGFIVRSLEPRQDLLYYWIDEAFEQIIIRE